MPHPGLILTDLPLPPLNFKVLVVESGVVDVTIPPALMRPGEVGSLHELLARLGVSVDSSSEPLPFDRATHGHGGLFPPEYDSDEESSDGGSDVDADERQDAVGMELSRIFKVGVRPAWICSHPSSHR